MHLSNSHSAMCTWLVMSRPTKGILSILTQIKRTENTVARIVLGKENLAKYIALSEGIMIWQTPYSFMRSQFLFIFGFIRFIHILIGCVLLNVESHRNAGLNEKSQKWLIKWKVTHICQPTQRYLLWRVTEFWATRRSFIREISSNYGNGFIPLKYYGMKA